jgi:D-alanine transaminase
LELAAAASMPLEVRRISVAELHRADEVWLSAATRDVLPITSIDGRAVGSGKPGAQWRKMQAAFERLKTYLKGTPAL